MTFQDGLKRVEKGTDLIKEGNHLIIDATVNAFFLLGNGGLRY